MMVIKNVNEIKIITVEKEFEIYCKRPLKLSEIKDLIRKKSITLKEFDLQYYSFILKV